MWFCSAAEKEDALDGHLSPSLPSYSIPTGSEQLLKYYWADSLTVKSGGICRKVAGVIEGTYHSREVGKLFVLTRACPGLCNITYI